MSLTARKKRTAAVSLVTTMVAGLSVAAAVSSPAQAIPAPQQSCAHGAQGNTAVNGWRPVAGSAVSVNNGAVARLVVVNFNADAGVDAGAEIRLGYRVDAGPVQTPGAQNFANHDEFWETRHSMVVLRVPPGAHRIQPYWRISGAAGKQGVIASRCLTAEVATS